MELLIMGPPGAGKGTQAKGIAAHYGVPAVSTGEMFRQQVKDNTELGQQVSQILNDGGYVPDDLTVEIVRERLSQPDAQKGFLLDGFPRTLPQVRALDELLAERHAKLDAVLSLTVDPEVLVERLLKRSQIEGRSDDSEAIVRKRQQVYVDETKPLLAEYRERGLLVEVDGLGEIDEVAARITAALDAKVQGQPR